MAEVVEVVLLRKRRPPAILTTTLLDQSIRFGERGFESGKCAGSIDRPSILEPVSWCSGVVRIIALEEFLVSTPVAVDDLLDLASVTNLVSGFGEPTGVRDADPVLESTEEPVHDPAADVLHRSSPSPRGRDRASRSSSSSSGPDARPASSLNASAKATLITWSQDTSSRLPSGSPIMP